MNYYTMIPSRIRRWKESNEKVERLCKEMEQRYERRSDESDGR